MSRCFPFPPPGYDKKIPFDDEKWIEKAKREKKHKKEKRDKKDKERKEKKRDKKDEKRKHKKEKERSEGGQREKKDSTEKLKDNKLRETEQKNTSVENDKHREGRDQPSTENDTVEPLKYNSVKKLDLNCTQRDDTGEFNFLLDSGKRTRDDFKVKVSPLVQKNNLTGKNNPEEPGTVFKDKRDNDIKVYRQCKEFVARSPNNYSLPNYIGGEERKVARVPGLADKRTTQQKENGMHNNVDGKKEGHKDPNREKISKLRGEIEGHEANVKVPDTEQLKTKENIWNAACFDNGKPSPLSKIDNKTSNLGKRKALGMNDVLLHDKESLPNKLTRFHPPSNHVAEGGKFSEPCTTPTQPISNFPEKVQTHKGNSKVSYNGSKLEATKANIQLFSERQEKRDSYDVNNNILSSHPVVQKNGVASNMCYASKQFASEQLQTTNGHNMDDAVAHMSSGGDVIIDDLKVNHKDLKINRLEEGKNPNISSTRPSSKKVKKNGEVSAKPPHPDSKYLNQILNIPSVEWPDMDNQEWLFGGDKQQSTKSKSSSSQVAESEHVWSKALRIESADITALPYVIPY